MASRNNSGEGSVFAGGLKCSGCGELWPKSRYSASQLKKKGRRRCADCVNVVPALPTTTTTEHDLPGVNAGAPSPPHFLVEGAGTPEVNGAYTISDSSGHSFLYEKPGEEGVTIYIHAVSPPTDERTWYISAVPPGAFPGDDDCIVLYAASGRGDPKFPPQNGWRSVTEGAFGGLDPPPTVTADTEVRPVGGVGNLNLKDGRHGDGAHESNKADFDDDDDESLPPLSSINPRDGWRGAYKLAEADFDDDESEQSLSSVKPLPASFRIKYVERGDGSGGRLQDLPVLLSPADRPNDVLLAVTNTLLAGNHIQLPSYGADSIAVDDVKNLLVNRAFEQGNEAAALRLMEELPVLEQNGLEVPLPGWCNYHNGIRRHSIIFEALGLNVVHGCQLDPDDPMIARLAARSWNSPEEMVDALATERKLAVAQASEMLERICGFLEVEKAENYDEGDMRLVRDLFQEVEEAVGLAMSIGHDARKLWFYQRALSEADSLLTRAEEIDNFVKSSHQVQHPHGMNSLREAVSEGEVCVLYEKKQFFTLTKGGDQGLFTLVTDPQCADDHNIVWEQRTDPPAFVDGYFASVGTPASTREVESGDTGNGHRQQEHDDAELAMRLQNEDMAATFASNEAAELKAAMAASLRESGGAQPTGSDGPTDGQEAYGGRGAQGGSGGRGDKVWNVELAVAMEVRSKHAIDDRSETYSEFEMWEVWHRGAIDIRGSSDDIRREEDLSFGLDSRVRAECGCIIRGDTKVVPETMIDAAADIVINERLMRAAEHSCLEGLLSGVTEAGLPDEEPSPDTGEEPPLSPPPDPELEKSASRLQALWRGGVARRDLKRRIQASIRMQAAYRSFASRAQYKAMKEDHSRLVSATHLQAGFRGFRARRDCRLMVVSAPRINAVARGRLARKRHSDSIKAGFEEWKRLTAQWKPVEIYVQMALSSEMDVFSWSELKKANFDISQADEDEIDQEDLDSTSRRINAAYDTLSSEADVEADADDDDGTCNTTAHTVPTSLSSAQPSASNESEVTAEAFDRIMLTHAVLKWFKAADPKYKSFFRRRIRQLAAGEKSRILRKHLTGCQHTIFETYLDQASAQRIIWTECREKSDNGENGPSSILVWYVSKHKWVSRYIKQIDEAEARMNRQFSSSAAHLFENESGTGQPSGSMMLDSETILLDPMANVPLKIHQMALSDIDKLEKEAWTPPLRLTAAEKEVVQKLGTVLVLGRSGTGKTVCICNRMVWDAERHREATTLRQLFIARSHRIKNLVQSLVSEELVNVDHSRAERNFLSYERIIRECDVAFNRLGIASSLKATGSLQQQCRDFADFKLIFADIGKEVKTSLNVLVIWTQIRSYIKGSIDAVRLDRPLSEEEYLELGKSRCRLDPKQRREAYAVYERYSQWLQSNNFHDACDRTADLLSRFRQTSLEDRMREKIKYDRIYVDEVQDFTNSDVALFWMLCEGAMFLAGDTAQSVEQGIDFRFDEVRSICHYLGGGIRRNVPDKPLSVTLNFRSHSGVLDVAATLLKMLHKAFPGAANKLPDDVGLFKGPRPCILSQKNEKHLDISMLQEVLRKNPGLVLLTPDDHVEYLKKSLASSESYVILGICESKGLDFDEIALVDFFSTSTKQQEKAWKALWRDSSNDINQQQRTALEMSQYPELEMRVKLLYTGVTRCRHRLFFVETQNSSAGDAFARWLLGADFAEKQDVADLREKLKSPDEWKSLGVDYALNAESQDVSKSGAAAWFERAVVCFEQGGDSHLASKARSHSLIRARAEEQHQQDWDTMKTSSPQLLELCFKEGGFVEEAIEICETVLDRCPPKEKKLLNLLEILLADMKSVPKTRRG